MISIVFLLGFLLQLSAGTGPVQIDNGVKGEPEVICDSDAIALIFEAQKPFVGKTFVKGFAADDNCVQMGAGKRTQRFDIRHDACGVRRRREVNGVVISTTVIVSFHSIFITKVDRAYKVSCFYVEATKKVHQQIDVASLATQTIDAETQLPACRYEILSGAGPSGTSIRYAHIGDIVYHKWTCAAEIPDIYCMRVHSCTVSDGQGGPPVTVIDANGCSLDGVILQDLEYTGDLAAGKPAQVFKFADKAGMYFNCQIQLTVKDELTGCAAARPNCSQTLVDASDRISEVGDSSSEEYITPTSRQPTPPPTILTTVTKLTTHKKKPSGMAPGIAPTYATSAPFPVPPTTRDPYGRIVRRSTDSNKPPVVADIDLPEQALLVFGVEDDPNGRPLISPCSAPRLLTFTVIALTMLSILLTASCAVVVRQRRAFHNFLLKA